MTDTSGFYKYENNNLMFSPVSVISNEYILHEDDRANLKLPVDGWYWFDSEEEAKQFF